MAAVAALATSVAAIAALLFSSLSLRATQQQIGLSEQGQYTDRFGKAVEQLGSDKPNVRLGGIYALERLALDSARDRTAITEVLSAYARTAMNGATGSTCLRDKPPADVAPETLPVDLRAALTVLGRRIQRDDVRNRTDLSQTCLPRYADLSNLNFDHASLAGIRLDYHKVDRVTFRDSDLTGASMIDIEVSHLGYFDKYQPDPKYSENSFYNARLSRINLSHSLLRGIDFTQSENFNGVKFIESTITHGTLPACSFCNFSHATLMWTGFTGSTWSVADFSDSAMCGVIFARSLLTDVKFNRASTPTFVCLLADPTASFAGAKFYVVDSRKPISVGRVLSGLELKKPS